MIDNNTSSGCSISGCDKVPDHTFFIRFAFPDKKIFFTMTNPVCNEHQSLGKDVAKMLAKTKGVIVEVV